MQTEQDETKVFRHLFDESRSGGAGSATGPRILIADDEPLHLNSLRQLLSMSGFPSCSTVGSGDAALDILKTHSFDLLLLDIHMPGLDGFQVLDRLKSEGTDTSVIVISGDSSWDKATATLRRGADDFIRKPYSPEEVVSCIRNSLKKRRLQTENSQFLEKLHVSEQFHRFLVNQSPDFIFILDRDGRFRFVNDQCENLLGISKKQLIGKPIAQFLVEVCPFFEWDPDDWQRHPKTARNLELQLYKHLDDSLKSGKGKVTVELSAERIYSDSHKDGSALAMGTYGVARDISARKRAEALINYQAFHDLLTGLPNRALFNDRVNLAIRQARRDDCMLSIMFLDLDRFKLVNDTLGHATGDRLLQEMTKRIQSTIRDGDTLARIGGDEFLLLLPRINRQEDAELIADKIQSSQRAPLLVEGHELFVRSSIGIAIYPKHGDTADLLIRHADMAMYEVKNKGRSTYGYYAQELGLEYRFKHTMEQDLRKALEGNQFELHYQPLVHISDRSLVSMEALIRWLHPEKGLLKPDTFIPEAEDSGLIVEVGEWVLRKVIGDLTALRDSGQQLVPVSVNVSALQLEFPGFATRVGKLLEDADLPGRLLQVELTENALMRSTRSAIEPLRDLSALGVNIIIDDFGTGYSSLSYLKTLPIKALKIDQTFLGDIDPGTSRETIAGTIAAMAKGLGLGLVAEGVEEESQASYLMGIGCDCAQGYLFSEPISDLQSGLLLSGDKLSIDPSCRKN